MKVKLTIDLELPDKYADLSREHLRQILFDSYVNFTTCHHLEWAVKYGAEAHIGSDNENPILKVIAEDHMEWGSICKNAEWSFGTGADCKDDGVCVCGEPGIERFDNGCLCGVHCGKCWDDLVRDCRKRSW